MELYHIFHGSVIPLYLSLCLWMIWCSMHLFNAFFFHEGFYILRDIMILDKIFGLLTSGVGSITTCLMRGFASVVASNDESNAAITKKPSEVSFKGFRSRHSGEKVKTRSYG
jgi:hypothetical protein